MRVAAVILMVCCLSPLASAACYREKGPVEGPMPYCEDSWDQTQHPVGSTWVNSGCQSCTCGATGMECCDKMVRPRGFPEDCEVLYDWKDCTYEVVKRADPNIPCPHSAVGK
ncbi:beta-microseminoprotein-like [Engraulis encrasicolus]|uniref:beta-microseminoprotein-like n=1 Tax=Engraulis encrasicolus TaxID=184585 RepID=UPI002FD69F3E